MENYSFEICRTNLLICLWLILVILLVILVKSLFKQKGRKITVGQQFVINRAHSHFVENGLFNEKAIQATSGKLNYSRNIVRKYINKFKKRPSQKTLQNSPQNSLINGIITSSRQFCSKFKIFEIEISYFPLENYKVN